MYELSVVTDIIEINNGLLQVKNNEVERMSKTF